MYIFTKKKSEKKYKTEEVFQKSILGKKESVFSPHKPIQHDHGPPLEDPKVTQPEAGPFSPASQTKIEANRDTREPTTAGFSSASH